MVTNSSLTILIFTEEEIDENLAFADLLYSRKEIEDMTDQRLVSTSEDDNDDASQMEAEDNQVCNQHTDSMLQVCMCACVCFLIIGW